ncbi:expressed unknown protein [Seminavis robusta]|uniref:Uncharacterized protein n=1 Tax=Seminavis robusta TaxID=568900 RepID=A0A9N8D9Z2_9STRA|nr:expressed unknown protein [Seminavis robusta]|eukprot:Sro29_g019190.1 n/a (311) ;mRNA; r:97782-98714
MEEDQSSVKTKSTTTSGNEAAEEKAENANDEDLTTEANNNNGKNGNNHMNRKRKRESVDHYAKAYEKTQYEPIAPQPQEIQIPGIPYRVPAKHHPGTPLRQFAHSFRARLLRAEDKDCKIDSNGNNCQVIHQHGNGLCIVTAGSCFRSTHIVGNGNNDNPIQSIEFLVSPADPCSAGERRKRQAKMLKKGTLNNNNNNNTTASGIVTPSTIIAQVTLKNGSIIPMYALVWGAIMELNTHLTQEKLSLLQTDPLLDGYLAVILPTGPFPPNNKTQNTATTTTNNNIENEDEPDDCNKRARKDPTGTATKDG